jgi:hypothetical protein
VLDSRIVARACTATTRAEKCHGRHFSARPGRKLNGSSDTAQSRRHFERAPDAPVFTGRAQNYPQYEKCLAPGQSPLLKKYAVTFRLPGLSHAAQRVLLAASLTISHPFKQVREAYAGQIRAA